MYYLNKVQDIREAFIYKYSVGDFSIDKTGEKIIQITGASFIADEPTIFGKVNLDYVEKEIAWYESMSTNISDIYGDEKDPPSAWRYTANKHWEINSNYGLLIFSDKYYNQYNKVLEELRKNPNSRRGTMVYNRPSIWVEYNENGKNDWICTNATNFYIEGELLHCVVHQRSQDSVFGFKNDNAWHQYILEKLANDLELYAGHVIFQVGNLHTYEKHFHLIK